MPAVRSIRTFHIAYCSEVGGQCAFDIQYQPCAVPNGVCEVAGVVYTDNVTLAGLTVNAPLGAISYLHNQRFAGVPKTIDGVLGLSYQGHNSVGAAPLFECLYRAGMLTHNMFSLCFGPNGGTLTLVINHPFLSRETTKNVNAVRAVLIQTCTLGRSSTWRIIRRALSKCR